MDILTKVDLRKGLKKIETANFQVHVNATKLSHLSWWQAIVQIVW